MQSADYIFTDGCGLIAPQLAEQLVKQVNITYRNKKYMPSVFQIRYHGYKGILTYEPSMHGKILAKFRDSEEVQRSGQLRLVCGRIFKGDLNLGFMARYFVHPY